ncbi:MAG: glycosyltransferase [Caldilineaceae bacterium]|nr:glycosyltransferase [Caldilineaceae bacterium]
MNNPRVSVVMAVHNGEAFLREAMDSILTQTFGDFELIVIDDASTDSTPAILASYTDARIVLLTNQTNKGQTLSLNAGLAIARGELIARHDADDISSRTRFEAQVAAMSQQPALGLLGTGYQVIDRCGQRLETVLLPATNAELQARLESGNCFCHGSVMIRRSCLEEVGGYRGYFRMTQDYDLWLRLSERHELASLQMPLYQLRFDALSMSRKRRPLQLAYRRLARALAAQRRSQGREEALPEDVMLSFPPEPERLLNDARGTAYLYYAAGAYDKAAECLQRAETILNSQLNSEKDGQATNFAATWQSWAFDRALALSHLRGDAAQGAALIHWICANLSVPNRNELAQQMIGRLYADEAFKAFNHGHRRNVVPHMWRAIRADYRLLCNRGLWSISAKALLSRQ